MDKIKLIYYFVVDRSIDMGVDERFAVIVPFCLFFLALGLIIKFIFSGSKPRQNVNAKGKGLDKIQAVDGRIATRRFDRTEVNIKGSLASYTTDDCTEPKVCEVIDVSLTGVAIACRDDLEKDARIKVSLPNYDKGDKEKVFYVSGSIVRIKPLNSRFFEYGIHLFHTFKRESKLLEILMDKFK